MAELMEDHIRNHMPRKNNAGKEATEDLIEIVRTYLK
jgi:DNA-binding FrmR family transcriptional regulator